MERLFFFYLESLPGNNMPEDIDDGNVKGSVNEKIFSFVAAQYVDYLKGFFVNHGCHHAVIPPAQALKNTSRIVFPLNHERYSRDQSRQKRINASTFIF